MKNAELISVPKVKSVKRKAVGEIDAFAAALAAADTVKESKPKRARADDHILAGIEKSLAESARSLARPDSSNKLKQMANLKKTEGIFYNKKYLLL